MMHKWQDVELTFENGSTATMHFILNPRLGPTPEAAQTVWREASDENIQNEINKTRFPQGRVVDWKLK